MPDHVVDSDSSPELGQALVAFNYISSVETIAVDLLGSWDNFTVPYPMTRDSRRGNHAWTGCFRFKNIICDGIANSFTKPRHGCLRQGGRYWYFYRSANGLESCDDRQPISNECPLLPGQATNLLEVPFDVSSSLYSTFGVETVRPFTTDLSLRYHTMEMLARVRRIRHRQTQPAREKPDCTAIPARGQRRSILNLSALSRSTHRRAISSLPAQCSPAAFVHLEGTGLEKTHIPEESKPPEYRQFEHRRELVTLGLRFGSVLASAFGRPASMHA